jgi:hypothetical protein
MTYFCVGLLWGPCYAACAWKPTPGCLNTSNTFRTCRWNNVAGAESVTQKYFAHPSLVIYFFPTPPLKQKLGLQIRERLLRATQLNQSTAGARLRQNQFPQPTQHVLTFLHPILICRVVYWALVEMILPFFFFL